MSTPAMTDAMKEMAARVMELDGLATKGPVEVWEHHQGGGEVAYRLRCATRRQLGFIYGTRADADLFALSRTAMPALAAEVTRLTKELADARAWQEEIRGAIDRSGMGIMRTSQGPTGTMLGYRPEVDAEHERRTLEVIHENVDLQCEVRRLKAQLSALTASEKPKEPSKV